MQKNKKKLYFSVIIPTYNRIDEIIDLIHSLESQTLAKGYFEIIIVDDGSTDGTEEWILTFKERATLNLHFFKQSHKGPGAARNKGIHKGSGQIFVFIDSDCIVPPDWLSQIKNSFDEDPSIRAFGGRDDASNDFSPLLKAINYSMNSFISTGGMRRGEKKRLAKFYPRSFNMGVHREIVQQIGGFGELRHGQDIEYSHRIIKSGAKVIYIPEAVVYHKRRTSLIKFFKQVFNWGAARINLYKVDTTMLEPLHFMPAVATWFIVLVTFFAFLFNPIYQIWKISISLALSVLILSGVDAAIRWKSISTGLLVPIVMGLQITGYGLGFTCALIRRVIFNQGEWIGFAKKYY